jgi:hypothetical protein
MLSNGFDAPLHLSLEPSRFLVRFQNMVHMLAIAAVSLPSSLPFSVVIVLYFIIVISAVRLVRNYRHQLKSLPKKFCWQKNSTWIEYSNDEEIIWNVLPECLVTDWFVVARMESSEEKRSLLILKDQCKKQTFRRLRVKLRFFQGEAAIPTDAS